MILNNRACLRILSST